MVKYGFILLLSFVVAVFGTHQVLESQNRLLLSITKDNWADGVDRQSYHIQSVQTWFHNWDGYLYAFPLHHVRDEETGHWGYRPTVDEELSSGIIWYFSDIEENSMNSIVIVCSPEPIETIQEARAIWHDNELGTDKALWVGADTGMPRWHTLICD